MHKNTDIRFILLSIAIIAFSSVVVAGDNLTIRDIAAGKYAADNLRSLTPLADGESFAQISRDRDKILKYSFTTGEETGVIFDIEATEGEKVKSVDSYMPSPDNSRILIATQTKRIYRRSYTAEFYVYEVDSHRLTPLSANGPQQSPVWAPDSRRVAFVRDNNIFVVDIDGMSERQVTIDGRRNEVINGIPDWVNEEEFSFATSMAFTADSRHICWIRYDESQVKTYALQLFKGLMPERMEYADYPGVYDY